MKFFSSPTVQTEQPPSLTASKGNHTETPIERTESRSGLLESKEALHKRVYTLVMTRTECEESYKLSGNNL